MGWARAMAVGCCHKVEIWRYFEGAKMGFVDGLDAEGKKGGVRDDGKVDGLSNWKNKWRNINRDRKDDGKSRFWGKPSMVQFGHTQFDIFIRHVRQWDIWV